MAMAYQLPMEPEDWIEKKFEFVLPVGAYLAVLERVRGTPALRN